MDTVDAACRAAGAIRLATPGQLVELAGFFASAWLPKDRRIGVLSDSGGQGAIAADTAESWGLDVHELSAGAAGRVSELLPEADHIVNPIDLDGAGEKNLDVYADLAEVLLTDTDIDAVVVSGYFGCYGEDVPDLRDRELAVVDRLGELVAEAKKPVIVHSMSASSPAVTRLWEFGIPAYTSIEAAMRVLARAGFYAAHSGRLTESLELTGPVTPWGTGYAAARAVIEGAGIPVPAGVTVGSVGPGESRAPAEAAKASELRPPFALKAGWPAHKTEVGGIVLGLSDLPAVETAYADMVGRLGEGEYILEEMDTRDHVVEILVGGRQDENFGPLVIVAAGGTETELFADTWLELAPVTHTEALDMISRLSCSRLLTGWRGRPAADIDALAEIIVAVSRMVAGNNAIAEIEINPVRVAPDGALAVDALVVTTENPTAENVPAEKPNSEE